MEIFSCHGKKKQVGSDYNKVYSGICHKMYAKHALTSLSLGFEWQNWLKDIKVNGPASLKNSADTVPMPGWLKV